MKNLIMGKRCCNSGLLRVVLPARVPPPEAKVLGYNRSWITRIRGARQTVSDGHSNVFLFLSFYLTYRMVKIGSHSMHILYSHCFQRQFSGNPRRTWSHGTRSAVCNRRNFDVHLSARPFLLPASGVTKMAKTSLNVNIQQVYCFL